MPCADADPGGQRLHRGNLPKASSAPSAISRSALASAVVREPFQAGEKKARSPGRQRAGMGGSPSALRRGGGEVRVTFCGLCRPHRTDQAAIDAGGVHPREEAAVIGWRPRGPSPGRIGRNPALRAPCRVAGPARDGVRFLASRGRPSRLLASGAITAKRRSEWEMRPMIRVRAGAPAARRAAPSPVLRLAGGGGCLHRRGLRLGRGLLRSLGLPACAA